MDSVGDPKRNRKTGLRRRQLLAIIDAFPARVAYVGPDRRYRFTNGRYAERFGRARGDIAGMRVRELLGERRYAEAEPRLRSAFAGRAVRFEMPSRDPGDASHLGVSYVPDVDPGGSVTGVVAIILDVTARKQMEDAVRESERLLRTVFEWAPIGMAVVDGEGRAREVNRAMQEFLGDGPDAMPHLLAAGVARGAHGEAPSSLFDDLVAGHRRRYRVETRYERPDGTVLWGDTSAAAVTDPATGFQYAIAMVVDVTDRQLAREALQRSEAQYHELVEHATYGIYRSSVEGNFIAVNPALVEMLRYESAEDLLEVDMGRVYADAAERASLIARHRDAERIERVEVAWVRKDGQTLTVALSGRPVRDERGAVTAFDMIAEDVTARRELEAQLRQAQKMEAIGQLTGGIAHDFNNLLTVILGNLELLRADCPPESGHARADLDEALAAVKRGADLVKKLLGFSRRSKLDFAVLDLGVLAGDLAKVLRRVLPEHIRLEVKTLGDPLGVRADAGAVEQILLNLVTNARDAMPSGGMLRIEVDRTVADAGYHAAHPWVAPGPYVRLSVSDTGVGMDAVTKARIFEPFFTTKSPGAGTGLGMAMVYGLVKQHHGFVHVYSEPGQGTITTVGLPAVAETADPAGRADAPPEGALRGNETILVVEDERAIQRAAKRALEAHGYTVVLARDGEEAFDLLTTAGSVIDLIITDLVMPKLGGRQLYEALRARGSDTPVLFMSGYSTDDAREHFTPPANANYLQKPWTLSDLLTKVRAVLDGSAKA